MKGCPHIFCFLDFFKIKPKVSTWRVSSLWDQPFRFFPPKMDKMFNFLFEKVFVAKICSSKRTKLFKNEHVIIFTFRNLLSL